MTVLFPMGYKIGDGVEGWLENVQKLIEPGGELQISSIQLRGNLHFPPSLNVFFSKIIHIQTGPAILNYPRLFAFDLDGTLLDSKKRISPANAEALEQIMNNGAVVVFASGRLGSSMKQFFPQLGRDLAMLTLNGADVFMDSRNGCRRVYKAPLSPLHADYLIGYAQDKPFALNYYYEDRLYSIKNENSRPWIDLYFQQTSTRYNFLNSFEPFRGKAPSKVIFVGHPSEIDVQEKCFRRTWEKNPVYICRTWSHYLEFLDVKANKGIGLEALASAYGIDMEDVVAFGDAENDMPMLSRAGWGVAMKNSGRNVKECAARVTDFTNDQDGVAREWQKIRSEVGW
ncbi:MAG: Cof-type HAD-IIB family hydrolase [Chitinispirillaceae bacterium]